MGSWAIGELLRTFDNTSTAKGLRTLYLARSRGKHYDSVTQKKQKLPFFHKRIKSTTHAIRDVREHLMNPSLSNGSRNNSSILSLRQKDACAMGVNCKSWKSKEIVSNVKGDQRNQPVFNKAGTYNKDKNGSRVLPNRDSGRVFTTKLVDTRISKTIVEQSNLRKSSTEHSLSTTVLRKLSPELTVENGQ